MIEFHFALNKVVLVNINCLLGKKNHLNCEYNIKETSMILSKIRVLEDCNLCFFINEEETVNLYFFTSSYYYFIHRANIQEVNKELYFQELNTQKNNIIVYDRKKYKFNLNFKLIYSNGVNFYGVKKNFLT